jgi:hypothetical protein
MSDHGPGHRRWFVPDCYLPGDAIADPEFPSHESCCILNAGTTEAHCRLTLYFEDAEPVRDIEVTVGAERCRHVRLDRLEEIAGMRVPRDVPYALAVESDQNIVVQHSRLDSRGGGLAYMTVMGFFDPR